MAKKSNNKIALNAILYPIVVLVAGICMIVFGSNLLDIALYIIGALFVVSGIITLIKREFLAGIINLFIGIVIILLGSVLFNFAVLIIGILLLVVGIVGIVKLIIDKRKEILNYVAPIVMILVGVLLVWGNFKQFLDIIIMAAGICLIIYGVYKLFITLFQDKLNIK